MPTEPADKASLTIVKEHLKIEKISLMGRRKRMKHYQEFEINYYQDEEDVFTATVPAIRGCGASGKTLREAYRNTIDAIESCCEAREKVAAMQLKWM